MERRNNLEERREKLVVVFFKSVIENLARADILFKSRPRKHRGVGTGDFHISPSVFFVCFFENLRITAAPKEKLCLLNTSVRFVCFFNSHTDSRIPFPERSAELKLLLTPTDFCEYAMCKDIIICPRVLFSFVFFDQKISPQRFVSYSYFVFFFNRF